MSQEKYHKNKLDKHFVTILITLVLFFLGSNMLPAFATETEKASLYTNLTEKNTTIELEIWTNPEKTAINASGIYLKFSTSTISVKEIKLNNNFCKMVIKKSIDPQNGLVSILCGLPSPGKKSKTKIAQINFNKINYGWANIEFDEQSMILANDGLGTNLLKYIENKNILIKNIK